MKIAPCSSCGAEMIWTLTEKGARMPVDAEPSPAGNLLLDTTLDPPRAKYLRAPEKAARVEDFQSIGLVAVFYVSHFSSCPFAGQHRTTGRAPEKGTAS